MAERSHITPQHNACKDTGSRPRKGPFLLGWKLCRPCDFQAAPTLSPQLHSLGAGELLREQTPKAAALPCPSLPAQHSRLPQNLLFLLAQPGQMPKQRHRNPSGRNRLISSSGLVSPHSPSRSQGDAGAGLRAQPDPGRGGS